MEIVERFLDERQATSAHIPKRLGCTYASLRTTPRSNTGKQMYFSIILNLCTGWS
jgi:hypothetical protein